MSPGGKKIILVNWKKKQKVGQEIYNGDKTNINTETIECFMGFVMGLLCISVNTSFSKQIWSVAIKKKKVLYHLGLSEFLACFSN